jgi:hypothetical protein
MMPQLCARREASDKEYQGLVRTVNLFASHPDFPGKSAAVIECVEDIEERSRGGRLTPAQRSELLSILLFDRSSN